MGFWHTGNIEHHEETGLGNFRWTPPVYPCEHCRKNFDSADDYLAHRVQSHPSKEPALLVRGEKAPRVTPMRIRTRLNADDVQFTPDCERAWINGTECGQSAVGRKLSSITDGTMQVKLANKDTDATFTLRFKIPCERDLDAVDQIFDGLRCGKRLDRGAMDKFDSCIRDREHKSPKAAECYADGISEYLYGVLAKERRETTLPYKAYPEQWNQSAEKLRHYDRPLARIIRALIAFHRFNQFDKVINLAGNSRIGAVAARFHRWLGNDNGAAGKFAPCEYEPSMDEILTDRESETMIRFCASTPAELAHQLRAVEALVCGDIPKHDRVKLRVLLAEFYAYTGNMNEAGRHARELMHYPAPFDAWAKRFDL